MKKSKIVAIVVAIVLVGVGLLIGAIGLHALGYDFTKLNLFEYYTETAIVEEDFSNIEIDIDTADVRFVLTDDDTCKVVYNETEKTEYVVTVEGGTLKIRFEDHRKWYDYIGIFFESEKMTVYLPRAEYENVSFKSDTGDLSLSGMTLQSLTVNVRTGDVSLSGLNLQSLTVQSTTGDVALSALNVQSALNITTDTGDVECESVNCQSLQIRVDTGDIELAGVIASQTMTIKSDTAPTKFRITTLNTTKDATLIRKDSFSSRSLSLTRKMARVYCKFPITGSSPTKPRLLNITPRITPKATSVHSRYLFLMFFMAAKFRRMLTIFCAQAL